MCLSTTGFGSDAALLGATRLRAAGEPISPNIAIETVQIYEEHSSHPCPWEHSSRENNIVSYNLPIPGHNTTWNFRTVFLKNWWMNIATIHRLNTAVSATTYHSTLYSRTITIPWNSEPAALFNLESQLWRCRFSTEQVNSHRYKRSFTSVRANTNTATCVPSSKNIPAQTKHHACSISSKTNTGPLTSQPSHNGGREYLSNSKFLHKFADHIWRTLPQPAPMLASPITDSNAGSKNNNNNLDDTTLLVVGQTECEWD